MAVTPPSNSAAAAHSHADVILDGTVTTDVDLNAQTTNTIVNNFSHTDKVIVSADVLHGIESGQLSVAVTATSVEVDNVATGQTLIHVNLDHTIGTIGVHPMANGTVSVTLKSTGQGPKFGGRPHHFIISSYRPSSDNPGWSSGRLPSGQ